MTRRLISSGSPFEEKIGYSRAVVQETPIGTWCWVAGTTGYDYAKMEMPEDPADQARNILATIQRTLHEAGCGLEHVVRTRYIVTDIAHWEPIIPVLGTAFGDIRPASTMMICGLATPEMKIEIEADAFKPV